MRAMVLTGIRQFEIRDVPTPPLSGDFELLIKIGAVGVCGSDIHYYTEGRIGDQIVQYPFTIGHECAGIVEMAGDKVSRVKPGDVIAIDPAIACGQCSECWRGRLHTCLNSRFLGCPGQAEGCMAEYIVLPEENCYPLSKDISLETAAFVEPLSIGYYAASFLKNLSVQNVGILGVGPIGLSVLFSCKTEGIAKMYVTDKLDYRLAVAKQLGAGWAGNPLRTDIVREIRQNTVLDAVFECCGDQEALNQAIDLLKPGGMLIIVGIPGSSRVSFNIHKLRRKEITIQNVRRQNNCTRAVIELLETHKVDATPLITHKFKLEDSQSAFDLVDGYLNGVIKAVIQI